MAGPNNQFDPITDGLPEEKRRAIQFTKEGDDYACRIPLPATATALPVLGEAAGLKLSAHDRQPPTPPSSRPLKATRPTDDGQMMQGSPRAEGNEKKVSEVRLREEWCRPLMRS